MAAESQPRWAANGDRRSFPRSDLGQRPRQGGFGDLNVERDLRAQPIAVREAEEAAEAEVGIGGDGAFAGDDFADPLRGNADLFGEAILRDAHWEEKLLEQQFARRNGLELGHDLHS